jgi:5-oxoprolinase (ATP-hydrolysing)
MMYIVGWQFWIDRGGTFTDVVARHSDGTIDTLKLLSDNPRLYDDAAIEGIRRILGLGRDDQIPSDRVDEVKMGTTVATNALLERQGARTVYVTTRGFGDALRIGNQARPEIFALDIALPEMLYEEVIEVDERVAADGTVLTTLDPRTVRSALHDARQRGVAAVAINLLHGYRSTDHEQQIGEIARELGFEHVSSSHEVSPLMKLVPRGDTTVVDAYLSPILRRYVDRVDARLRPEGLGPLVMFMQSNGGLADAHRFRGKDALLSGPAGGVVGMVRTGTAAGFDRLIGFDMGGTSTDVSHYSGELERTYDTEVAGVRVRAPMLQIHTVAAGGGSVLHFDGARLRVGPDSAGADPGPVCYRNGGPLAITDCNVVLGKLRPEYFPCAFGPLGDEPLAVDETRARFGELADEVVAATGVEHTAESIATGFLDIAVENMANAIKKISVQRGHDVSEYALACFGGAGGQHACMVADRLGITTVHIHPHAGVLSAVGIGLADVREVNEHAVERRLDGNCLLDCGPSWEQLDSGGRAALEAQGVAAEDIALVRRVALRYAGSDTSLVVDDGSVEDLRARFEAAHRARFGFVVPERDLIVESLQLEAVGGAPAVDLVRAADSSAAKAPASAGEGTGRALGTHPTFMGGAWHDTPFLDRADMPAGTSVDGPAVLVEANATTVVEPGWRSHLTERGDLVINRVTRRHDPSIGTQVDPVQLEIFNNLFMNVAEQMGVVLENTASSVNIKERLDFSCAIFDPRGDLVANAPHIPVHLGSMSESIKSIIVSNPELAPGQVFVMNAPYNGGTHLPDVTVVKPVFDGTGAEPIFYVAARGHHADIGGTTPGSAPADSTSVDEEGVLIDNFLLVDDDTFRDDEIRELLTSGPHPARNPDQNVADLQAQVAACERGTSELLRVVDHYGLPVVHAYMNHVQDNGEESVRRVIDALGDAAFTSEMDDGHRVSVRIGVDRAARRAIVDFTGTSPTHPGNYNAPSAIARAAVLYVFRCLVRDDIPLNAGCMRPLELVLPSPSMVAPHYPAAVIAGNVETSQLIVDTLFGALGVMAASQGTMNNLTWGDGRYQYYETICGGAGATGRADGCDAVHTHMTNSRLTDPEVLEWRYPVLLDTFHIRRGSGGKGTHRGGDGTVRRVRFTSPMQVNVLSSRRRVRPFGLAGGEPGEVGRNRVIRADGAVEELPGNAQVEVGPGDIFEIQTPGGGGFGPAGQAGG